MNVYEEQPNTQLQGVAFFIGESLGKSVNSYPCFPHRIFSMSLAIIWLFSDSVSLLIDASLDGILKDYFKLATIMKCNNLTSKVFHLSYIINAHINDEGKLKAFNFY